MNPDAPEGYAFPAHEGVWSQQLHVTDELHQEVYQVPKIEHAVIKIDDRVSTIEERGTYSINDQRRTQITSDRTRTWYRNSKTYIEYLFSKSSTEYKRSKMNIQYQQSRSNTKYRRGTVTQYQNSKNNRMYICSKSRIE